MDYLEEVDIVDFSLADMNYESDDYALTIEHVNDFFRIDKTVPYLRLMLYRGIRMNDMIFVQVHNESSGEGWVYWFIYKDRKWRFVNSALDYIE